MPAPKSYYITTPIYYVNGSPHIGHAYTSIAADVMRRWNALQGHDAWMLTGTDEHGQKVYESALKRGLSPKEHVDDLVGAFQEVLRQVRAEPSDFIRTTELRHSSVVQDVLQHLWERGDIYAADYEGWYSKTAERFWTEKDLVDGRCPDTGEPVEWIREKNYFFRMSSYVEPLKAWMEAHPDCVQPDFRRNEVMAHLRKEVGDLCISRPRARLPWGIALPFDVEYVTYVWFDALLNYITALGYHPDPARRSPDFDRRWPADVHLIGKDILMTHAVYWPTMLLALGLEPARCLMAHGWWLVGGRKSSKSFRNTIDPFLLSRCYGADAFRYFMLREVPFGLDGNFDHQAMFNRVNADLANDLGNLAHRALSMTERWLGGRVPELDPVQAADEALEALAASVRQRYGAAIDGLQFSAALEALWELVAAGNKYIDSEAPWRLNREGKVERLAGVMRRSLEICRVAACLLWPICPDKMEELARKLHLAPFPTLEGSGHLAGLPSSGPLTCGEPLFPRHDALPAEIAALLAQAGAEEPAPSPAPRKSPKKKAESPASEAPMSDSPAETGLINIDDFAKVALRAGRVVGAERHPKADRLLVLKVDLGEAEPRTICAGIAARYNPEELMGQQIVVVANLAPRPLRGITSQGMVLAAGAEGVQALVTLTGDVTPGTVIR
jgi:methionyl-tRNA synthetase